MAPSLYTKNTWNNDDVATPVSAARLTKMETGITDAHYRPRGAIFATTVPSLTSGTYTEMGFTAGFTTMTFTEEYDSEGWHPGASMNPGNVRIGLAGIYLCTGFVGFPANNAGRRQLAVGMNGNIVGSGDNYTRRRSSNDVIQMSVLGIIKAAVGDRLGISIMQSSGAGMVPTAVRLTWTLLSYA